MTKNRHLTFSEQRLIASEGHVWILDGLSQKTSWKVEDIVFQGGTSLALAWDSPRFSEDLDFVARSDLDFISSMKKVAKHLQNGLQHNFLGASVKLKFKEEENPHQADQNMVFTFVISIPNVLGNVKIKTEFWKVAPELIKSYDGEYRLLAKRGTVKPLFGVASQEQIFFDKLIALGGRERLKWRDIFDLWYLDAAGVPQAEQLKPEKFVEYLENTLSLYNTAPQKINDNWVNLLNRSNEEIVGLAERDLKPWLSEDLWGKLYPKEVENMVLSMKEKLKLAVKLFPPEEYKNLSAERFKEVLAEKRQGENNNNTNLSLNGGGG